MLSYLAFATNKLLLPYDDWPLWHDHEKNTSSCTPSFTSYDETMMMLNTEELTLACWLKRSKFDRRKSVTYSQPSEHQQNMLNCYDGDGKIPVCGRRGLCCLEEYLHGARCSNLHCGKS